MKKLIFALLFVSLNAFAAQYKAVCYFPSGAVTITDVTDYGDDMMTYNLVVSKDGKVKRVRVPKNMCIIEESK